MKTYGLGLLIILITIQPYFLMKFIGANMDFFISAWVCGVIAELLIAGVLCLPYLIGRLWLEMMK